MKIVATTTRHRDAAALPFEKYVSAAEENLRATCAQAAYCRGRRLRVRSPKSSIRRTRNPKQIDDNDCSPEKQVLHSAANNSSRVPPWLRTLFDHGIVVTTIRQVRPFVLAVSPFRVENESINNNSTTNIEYVSKKEDKNLPITRQHHDLNAC